MRAHTRSATLLAWLAAAVIMTMAAPAHAIYIATPLTLEAGTDHSDVGRQINFTIYPSPDNESARSDWAGQTLKIRFFYDPNESESGDPDEPTSSDSDPYVYGDLGNLTLDDNASGSFNWTVPAEVDDHNVDVFLEDEAGERQAFTFFAVGDAPPQMRVLAGSGPVPPGAEPGVTEEGKPVDDHAASGAEEEAPTFGIIMLMVVLGAVAVGMTVLLRRA